MARTDIAGGAFYHADVRVGRIETAERGRTQSMRRSSGWSRTLRVTRYRRRCVLSRRCSCWPVRDGGTRAQRGDATDVRLKPDATRYTISTAGSCWPNRDGGTRAQRSDTTDVRLKPDATRYTISTAGSCWPNRDGGTRSGVRL